MENGTFPTEKQREMLGGMIHAAFIELRLLGWGGHASAAADLADAFHNLPVEMFDRSRFDWDLLRGMLGEYQRKWRESLSGRNYVQMLDQIRCVD